MQAPQSQNTGSVTDCPQANNQRLITTGQTFKIMCGADIQPGATRQTLSESIDTSFSNCVNKCASMDFFQNRTDVSAVYNLMGKGPGGSCECVGSSGIDSSPQITTASTWLALIQ
jgi:hypothetical protein